MWRKYGDAFYVFLVGGIFALETLALCVLTWGFVARATNLISPSKLQAILLAAVSSTVVALLLLGAYLLAYHYLSTRDESRERAHEEEWTERWIESVLDDTTSSDDLAGHESGPLPRAAVDAALNLLEVLRAEEGERIKHLLTRHGVTQSLIDGIRSRRLRVRLDSLESLAKARLPEAYGPVLAALGQPTPVVRRMAVRTAARTLAAMPSPAADDLDSLALADAVKAIVLPTGVLEEALLLLDVRAPHVLSLLLNDPTLPVPVLRATLETAGRLALTDLSGVIAGHASHGDPEVRSACFRALVRAGVLPADAHDLVLMALGDEVDFVRVQATHAAVLLPKQIAIPALLHRMRDVSWWVRRAAAESLVGQGHDGVRDLKRAARSHSDRYAREMAIQVLLESDLVDHDEARRLRDVA